MSIREAITYDPKELEIRIDEFRLQNDWIS